MPQLVVNMKVNTQNKVSCKLKRNRFIQRHAPYSTLQQFYKSNRLISDANDNARLDKFKKK